MLHLRAQHHWGLPLYTRQNISRKALSPAEIALGKEKLQEAERYDLALYDWAKSQWMGGLASP